MTKENALDRYTNAVELVEEHKKANKVIFEEHQRLMLKLIDAENDLRDAVAEENQGVENSEFKVVVSPQTQRVYNEEKLHQYLTPTQFAQVVNDVKRPPRISIKKN